MSYTNVCSLREERNTNPTAILSVYRASIVSVCRGCNVCQLLPIGISQATLIV